MRARKGRIGFALGANRLERRGEGRGGSITVPSTCVGGNSAWLVAPAARVYTVRWPPLPPGTTHPPLNGRHSRKHAYHLYVRYVPPTKNISLCHTILATLKLERRGASESKSGSPTNWTTFFFFSRINPRLSSLPPPLPSSLPLLPRFYSPLSTRTLRVCVSRVSRL